MDGKAGSWTVGHQLRKLRHTWPCRLRVCVSCSAHPVSVHVLASVLSTQLPSLEPECLVLRTGQLHKGLDGPMPYHLAEKRPRPSAFPPDTFSLVVSDLKGHFLPSVEELLLGVVCRFCSKAVQEPSQN